MGGAFIQGETERAAKKGPFKIIPFEETGLFCNPPQTGETEVLWVKNGH